MIGALLLAAGCHCSGLGVVAGDSAGSGSSVDSRTESAPDSEAPPGMAGGVALLHDAAAAEEAWAEGQEFYALYLPEVLAHAGLPFQVLQRAALLDGLDQSALLLPWDAALTSEELAFLQGYVEGGGTLVAMGGSSGLDELLGIEAAGSCDEGWISGLAHGELFEGDLPPLHVFGGSLARPTTATQLAGLLDQQGADSGLAAVTRRQVGAGTAWYIGPCLAESIVRIRQGIPIHQDGQPAADGTASVDDGILKTDDGIVLDYERDRASAGGQQLFLEPVADNLAELLLRVLADGFARQGQPLPMLWYWPGELDAVGVISHDTDGNDPYLAGVLLERLQELALRSTWCFIRYPEDYPPELFQQVAQAGGEVALHYDAHSGYPETSWSQEDFDGQLAWLRQVAQKEILTNKNHYLRWEGWTEFYRWCQEAGIRADQSKGPSKSGNVGFPYGSAHPYFPMDDFEHENAMLDVLAINLYTQDLHYTCNYEVGPALVDEALAVYGVAHFLFHPAHVERSGVAQAMADVTEYGRGLGMEWWTVAEVDAWERLRRQVAITPLDGGFLVSTAQEVPDASFLVFALGELPLLADGEPIGGRAVEVYGAQATRFTLDLPAGETEVSW